MINMKISQLQFNGATRISDPDTWRSIAHNLRDITKSQDADCIMSYLDIEPRHTLGLLLQFPPRKVRDSVLIAYALEEDQNGILFWDIVLEEWGMLDE